MFHWSTTQKPIVALAPMAGVTDASYRQFTKSIAQEIIVFTEFLSTDAIHFGAQKTLKMLAFDPNIEKPFIVQIFGNDRDHFISSCKVIEEMGADGIDINMGCPAAKVVSSCHGSALIRRPDLAADLVHAACKAVSIPVSVKTRLGWDNAETLIPFCAKLQEAGAAALSIHGRTYKGKFSGEADWTPIYELKKHVSIPVIGNGDIASADDAVAKIQNLDGVMVGRGTMGNPWLMKEIVDALQFRSLYRPSTSCFASLPDAHAPRPTASRQALRMTHIPQSHHEKIPFILMHCELSIKHKGEKRGILEMRKHLAGYIKGFDGAKEIRMRLMGAEKLKQVEQILHQSI
jgi:tRNA-dihydrouridine synthase B